MMDNIKSMMVNMPQDSLDALYHSIKDLSNINYDLIDKNLQEAKEKLK